MQGNVKKGAGMGVRDTCPACSAALLQPNMAAVWIQQLGFFFLSPFKSYFLSLPSNNSLHNKFTCNDWKFCTEKQNIKILLEPVHMLGNIKSSLN